MCDLHDNEGWVLIAGSLQLGYVPWCLGFLVPGLALPCAAASPLTLHQTS